MKPLKPRSPSSVTPRLQREKFRTIEAIPFFLVHLACFAALLTGVHVADLAIAIALYAARMFGITAGYHRYFSHRSYKTSRFFAFLLAFLAQSSAQRGVLWWAAAHRHHHRFSDTDNDVHSPVRRGFWYAHLGWIFTDKHRNTNLDAVPDLARFPELLWLDRHPYFPAVAMALLAFAIAGWSGLVIGFCWSTVVLWHATFSINSIAHVIGRKRYLTGDQSRNNWWLALLTFGEGWHNNHHHFQSAARQGFHWYEIDFSYYTLLALSRLGLVWDLQTPPERVVRAEQRLRRAVVEKAANELASSFPVEQIAGEIGAFLTIKRASLDSSLQSMQDELSDLVERYQRHFDQQTESLRAELLNCLHAVDLAAMPSVAELRDRGAAMFVRTPSLNDIAERARQMLLDALCEHLVERQTVPVNNRR